MQEPVQQAQGKISISGCAAKEKVLATPNFTLSLQLIEDQILNFFEICNITNGKKQCGSNNRSMVWQNKCYRDYINVCESQV